MATSPFRDWHYLKAIAALLKATGQFDSITMFSMDEAIKASGSNRLKLANLSLAGFKNECEFTGEPSPVERTVNFFLLIAVRHQDAETRDSELDRLANVATNAINHQSLGGETKYQETLILKGIYGPPDDIERRIKLVGQWVQIIDDVTDFNTSKGT